MVKKLLFVIFIISFIIFIHSLYFMVFHSGGAVVEPYPYFNNYIIAFAWLYSFIYLIYRGVIHE